MKYDFIEIGTSNFNTLIEKANDKTRGISVEPIKLYLDMLDDKPNIKKINACITYKKQCDFMKIYYIPLHIIERLNLPKYFRGCNSVGDYHPLHIKHGLKQHVCIENVRMKDFRELILENQVEEVKYIKIDTEGHDCTIMKGIYNFYLKNEGFMKPQKIQFETNENTTAREVKCIIKLFKNLHYIVTKSGNDTVLELNK